MGDWTKNQIVKSDLPNEKFDNLTIRIKTNGFVVFGFNKLSSSFFIDEYVFVRSFNFVVINTIVEKEYHSFIDDKFTAKVIYPTSYYSLVPQMYFSEFDLSSYFLHAISQQDKDLFDYNFDKLSFDEINCINAFSKSFFINLNKTFPQYELISESRILLNTCFDNYKQNIANKPISLYLNFFDDKVDDLLFVDNKLILMNRIEYHSIENFIYYILNALTQSNISSNKVEIIILGDIQKQSSIVLALSKYFDRIHFMNPSKVEILSETAHAFNLETNA